MRLPLPPPLLAIAATAFFGCATTRQPALRPPGISREEKVVLGRLPQTIFIRGRDRENPVLLFLHGGPGLPEMPFSHVNAELERDFTVVHWDQRGAGKSYRPDIPVASMNTDEFVQETVQLSRYLCRTLHQRKIYLAGFSWGSFIGAQAVAKHPELYSAYIGISQVVDLPLSERWLHRAGLAQAEQQGLPKVAAQLQKIGEPPYRTRREERLVNSLTKAMQPDLPRAMTRLRYVYLGLQSPYYSVEDDINLVRGLKFSGRELEADIWGRSLLKCVPEIDVAVYLFAGRYDTVVSAPLEKFYFEKLRAPRGKHFIWFEHSDHILHLEEPGRFQKELLHILAETRRRRRG